MAFMKIKIKLYGVLKIDRFGEAEFEYPYGTTVEDIVKEFSLPRKLIGAVVVNDVHSVSDHVLEDGDVLIILPLLDGG